MLKKFLMTGAVLLTLVAWSGRQVTAAGSRHDDAEPVPPAATADIPAGTYTLDRSHASLIFRVNHLGFSNYTARFKRFDARLQFDPQNLAASKVVASVDVDSLETDFPDPARLDFNAELKGEAWLDVAKFPRMEFESRQIDVTGVNTVRIHGDLTLHGVTRPIVLAATFNGGYAGHPMDPNARIGFSAQATLKRSEFGITYGIPAPGTTMGVSDEVDCRHRSRVHGSAFAAEVIGIFSHDWNHRLPPLKCCIAARPSCRAALADQNNESQSESCAPPLRASRASGNRAARATSGHRAATRARRRRAPAARSRVPRACRPVRRGSRRGPRARTQLRNRPSAP